MRIALILWRHLHPLLFAVLLLVTTCRQWLPREELILCNALFLCYLCSQPKSTP